MSVENQGVALCVTGAALTYGDTELVRDVNLSAAPGELLTLLGPSGSRKANPLRTITGFLPLTAGGIRFDGVRISELSIREGQPGVVFQEHHLFPALMVYRSLEVCLAGTVTACVTATEAAARIAELLPTLGLAGLEARFPAKLSGGQQRRVALVRVLLMHLQLPLLDEPFTSLDAPLRQESTELPRWEQRPRRLTTVSVTHDEEGAARIADSITHFCDTAGTRSFRQAPLQRF